MIDHRYLVAGLRGLGNAPRAGTTMAGHLGAAVVAGYFIGEDHADLDPEVTAAIESELDRVIAGEESIWFDPAKAGMTAAELFAPLPEEAPGEPAADSLADALANNIGSLRQSGHNAIFASIALRALRDHPDLATPALVAGIRQLIGGFDGAVPGRGYYGKEMGWKAGNEVDLPPDDGVAPYGSLQTMAARTIDELVDTAHQHRRGFGGLFHLVNHGAALVELDRQGYGTLARRGLDAHREHLRLRRTLPDLTDELGALEKAERDPWTPEYWARRESTQWSAWLTHRIKTLYGFELLLGEIEDAATKARARDRFRYLMA